MWEVMGRIFGSSSFAGFESLIEPDALVDPVVECLPLDLR